MKARVAVLVSGGGTNLQAILDAQKAGGITSGDVILVVSNVRSAYALTRAKNAGVEAIVCERGRGESRFDFEGRLLSILQSRNIDVIVLAGFMVILSKEFVSLYPDRIINVHPSLIPSFCGKGYYGLKVHEAALEYGVKVTGATVHMVNEIPDAGRILYQKAVEVKEGDTAEILQKRVMVEAEWILLPRAVEDISRRVLNEKGEI
ncbi:MAG: phosphoribosylglycinamide formyltransferase [Clostridia bacterium]|nr:phosphoribosylglycinamide formyltransferase [Clostridia bacterium]